MSKFIYKILTESFNRTPGGIKLEGILTFKVWQEIVNILEKEWGETKEFILNLTGERFNSNYCEIFCEAIIEIYGKRFIWKSNEDYENIIKQHGFFPMDHAFVTDGMKFYDIESPIGVKNVWELKIFQRNINNGW